MQALRDLGTMVVVLAACACTAHSGGATRTDASPTAATASNAPIAAEPSARQRMIDEVTEALLRADLAAAATIVERARRAVPPAQPSAELIAYFDATVHSYQGDY